MVMPKNLFFVRHGESDGNFGRDLLHQGKIGKDHEVFKIPDHELRLTPRGVQQAEFAGEWFKNNFDEKLYGFNSPFVRTMETTYHLKLGIKYRSYYALVERFWGGFSFAPEEKQKIIKRFMKQNPLYTTVGGGGQSLHDLFISNWIFFHQLHRKFSNKNVIAVCHGERILTLRAQLERLHDKEFKKIANSNRTGDQIRNCQILHYTRINPKTNEEAGHLSWMRSFCPWDLRDKDLKWKNISRPLLSESDLKTSFEEYPRFLSKFYS